MKKGMSEEHERSCKEQKDLRKLFFVEYKKLRDRFLLLSEKAEANYTLRGREFDDMNDAVYAANQELKAMRAWMLGWERGDSHMSGLEEERKNMVRSTASVIDSILQYIPFRGERGE